MSESVMAAGNIEVSKNAFLNLFVAQLQCQNPLDPMDNADFMNQLSQLTSMEQLTNMSQNIEGLGSDFGSMLRMLEMTYANSLLGRKVSFVDPNTSQVVTASVDAVQIVDGEVWLRAGSYSLTTDAVVSVEPA